MDINGLTKASYMQEIPHCFICPLDNVLKVHAIYVSRQYAAAFYKMPWIDLWISRISPAHAWERLKYQDPGLQREQDE